jgi:hypothetical protein
LLFWFGIAASRTFGFAFLVFSNRQDDREFLLQVWQRYSYWGMDSSYSPQKLFPGRKLASFWKN